MVGASVCTYMHTQVSCGQVIISSCLPQNDKGNYAVLRVYKGVDNGGGGLGGLNLLPPPQDF